MLAERIVTGESVSTDGIHRISSTYFDDDLGAIVEEEHDVRYENGREVSRDLVHRNISRHMQPLNVLGEMRPMEFVGYSRPVEPLISTTVQDALTELNASITGIEWTEDGPYYNGQRLNLHDISTVVTPADTITTTSTSIDINVARVDVIEELKDRVTELEEEIALLKMKFMEN